MRTLNASRETRPAQEGKYRAQFDNELPIGIPRVSFEACKSLCKNELQPRSLATQLLFTRREPDMTFFHSLSESGSLFLTGGVLLGVAISLRRIFAAFASTTPKQSSISK
jgi:hypothetical protein